MLFSFDGVPKRLPIVNNWSERTKKDRTIWPGKFAKLNWNTEVYSWATTLFFTNWLTIILIGDRNSAMNICDLPGSRTRVKK